MPCALKDASADKTDPSLVMFSTAGVPSTVDAVKSAKPEDVKVLKGRTYIEMPAKARLKIQRFFPFKRLSPFVVCATFVWGMSAAVVFMPMFFPTVFKCHLNYNSLATSNALIFILGIPLLLDGFGVFGHSSDAQADPHEGQETSQ